MASLNDWLVRAAWKASTYVAPHEYVLRWQAPELFDEMTRLIKAKGYNRPFRGKRFRSADLDGYTYWIIWPVLNRVRTVNGGNK